MIKGSAGKIIAFVLIFVIFVIVLLVLPYALFREDIIEILKVSIGLIITIALLGLVIFVILKILGRTPEVKPIKAPLSGK